MRGIDATFDGVSFEGDRNPRRGLQEIIPAAAALAVAGAIGVWVLHMRPAAAPDIANPPLARSATASIAAPAAGVAAKPYGEIVIDPSFLAEMKPAAPARSLSPLASLDAVPVPSRRAFSAAEPRRLSARPFRGRPASGDRPAAADARRIRSRRERAVAAASAS